jgi:hypothetical protein
MMDHTHFGNNRNLEKLLEHCGYRTIRWRFTKKYKLKKQINKYIGNYQSVLTIIFVILSTELIFLSAFKRESPSRFANFI